MNTTRTMHTVTISKNLYHDYESRGWVHDAGDHLAVVSTGGMTITIKASVYFLQAMLGDLQYQLECHDPDRNLKRSLLRHIDRVTTTLNNNN